MSAASIWEIEIKRALGKLPVPEHLPETILQAGCRPLPITWRHAQAVGQLPRHHPDPFDRMLIAQARCEGLTLMTADPNFRRYDLAPLSALGGVRGHRRSRPRGTTH